MKKKLVLLMMSLSVLFLGAKTTFAVNSSYTLNPYNGQGSVSTGPVVKYDTDSAVVNNKGGLGWGRSVAFRVRNSSHGHATNYIDANDNGRYYLAYFDGQAIYGNSYYLYSSRNSGRGNVHGVWAP